MTDLTENFSLEEMTNSQTAARMGIDNVPWAGSRERMNLQRVAGVMEKVRILLGDKPVLISSGYRDSKVNAAVGGSRNSAHMSGLAADFYCPDFGTPLQICRKLEPHMRELGIDQLIYEYGTWVHLGLAESQAQARQMTMTIDRKGLRNGFA